MMYLQSDESADVLSGYVQFKGTRKDRHRRIWIRSFIDRVLHLRWDWGEDRGEGSGGKPGGKSGAESL